MTEKMRAEPELRGAIERLARLVNEASTMAPSLGAVLLGPIFGSKARWAADAVRDGRPDELLAEVMMSFHRETFPRVMTAWRRENHLGSDIGRVFPTAERFYALEGVCFLALAPLMTEEAWNYCIASAKSRLDETPPLSAFVRVLVERAG